MKLLRLPHLAAQAGIDRDMQAAICLNFLHSASVTGLLRQLRDWKQRSELQPPSETLGALPDVGIALGEIKRDGDRYRIFGKRALALSGPAGDALMALVEEFVTYHEAVYRDFCRWQQKKATFPGGSFYFGKMIRPSQQPAFSSPSPRRSFA